MHHHPHHDMTPATTRNTARLGALVLVALLAAILGCATTGGAQKANESSNVKNFKRDYASVAVKKREAGDAAGAMLYWRQGLGTFNAQARDRNNPDGKVMRELFEEEWPKLSALLDKKIDEQLKAGNPYAAIRVAESALYSQGGRPVAIREDSLYLASKQVFAWHTRANARILKSRNLRAEARQAAADGHHALAMCLAAGAGDTRTRDQLRAKLETQGAGGKQDVALQVRGEDPGIIKAFSPYLQKRFNVVPQARRQITFEVVKTVQSVSKPRVYTKQEPGEYVTALSPDALRPEAALFLNAFLEVDNRLRKYVFNKCEKTDYAQCIGEMEANSCKRWLAFPESKRGIERAQNMNRYGQCTSTERAQDIIAYHERRKKLKDFIRISNRDAEIYTRQQTTKVKTTNIPPLFQIAGRVNMTITQDGKTLFSGPFTVGGSDRNGPEGAIQRAGQGLANMAMIRINQHLGARPAVNSAILKAPPGPAPANAFVQDTITKLGLGNELRSEELGYMRELCGMQPTSIYNDAKLKAALGM